MDIHFNLTFVSIILRLVSCIILAFFCIPLQWKETSIKNGLIVLRYQLLLFGLILFITNTFTLWFLFDVWFNGIPQRFTNSWLQIGNAICFLGMSILGYHIYHTQYSDENIKVHRKIAKMEKKNAKSI